MWEYGKNCSVFSTVSKSGSLLVHTANEPCDHMYRIPSPKSYAGCSSCKLLKETHLHVIGRRNLTTEMFRRMIRGGRAGSIPDLPDVNVLQCPVSSELWFKRFNTDNRRSIGHAMGNCVSFANGKPVCVPCQNFYTYILFLSPSEHRALMGADCQAK